MKSLLTIFVLSVLTTVGFAGETIFEENFDSEIYEEGKSIPVGFNQINLGKWENNSESSGAATICTGVVLSPAKALELRVESSGRAAVVAVFGLDSTSAHVTNEALKIRFAFNLQSLASGEFYVYGSEEGELLAYIQFLIGDGATGYARIWSNETAGETKIQLYPDTWYYAELLLPENPDANGEYTLKVYDNDGTTELGEASGAFYKAPEKATNYKVFCINNNAPSTSIYIDDILVKTLPKANE